MPRRRHSCVVGDLVCNLAGLGCLAQCAVVEQRNGPAAVVALSFMAGPVPFSEGQPGGMFEDVADRAKGIRPPFAVRAQPAG